MPDSDSSRRDDNLPRMRSHAPQGKRRPNASERPSEDLIRRVRELETQVGELEAENRSLRRMSRTRDDAAHRLDPDLYRSLYELNLDAVFMVDREGRFIDANPAAARQSGYSVEELRGMTFMDLCAPDLLDHTMQAFQENLLGNPRDIDTTMIRKDGRRVELLVSGAPMVNNSEVSGVFGVAKDITQRKAAEDAIRQADERLRLAAEAAGFGTYFYRSDTDQLEWSPELKRILGLPMDAEPRLDLFINRIYSADRERILKKVKASLRAKRIRLFDEELRIAIPGGSLRWIQVKGKHQPARDGKPAHSFGAVLDITESKRAEAALRESEQRLRGLIEAIPDTIQFKDPKGRWIVANQPALKAFNLEKVSWQGRDDQELARLAPEMKDVLESCGYSDHRVRERNLPDRIEETLPGPDGSSRIFDVIKVPLQQANEKPAGLLVLGRDITSRKQAEEQYRSLNATLEQQVAERTEKLRETEERFRKIYKHAATGIAITDREGRFVQCNPAYCRIVGYTESELSDLEFPSLIHPDDREENLRAIQPLLDGAVPQFEIVNRYVHKSGETVWVHKIVSVLPDERGENTHVVALVTDISERQRAEAALRRSEKVLSAFFSDAPVGLLWLDADGRVLRVNRAQLDMLGFENEDAMLGRPLADFDASEVLETRILDPLKRGKSVQSHRSLFQRADGSFVHTLIDASPVREGDRTVRSDWFVRNITRRVELERQLLEVVERERQQLGAELHDHLGQILHGIQFLTSELQLRLQEKGAEEAAELKRVNEYLEEALSTTRNVAKGLQPVPPVPEGLMVALQEHAALIGKLYNVNCRFHCPEPVEVADQTVATHIFRIAQEAVTNALKHADCNEICIELKTTSKQIVIGVRDDGNGRIPEPNHRSGMGLRVMQFRAAAIKGSLVLQNTPGNGTVVVCTITPTGKLPEASPFSPR